MLVVLRREFLGVNVENGGKIVFYLVDIGKVNFVLFNMYDLLFDLKI